MLRVGISIRAVLVLAACILFSQASLYAQQPTQYPCGSESSLKSLTATSSVILTFVNRTSGSVNVYWLDYNGARQFYFALAPGLSQPQQTYPTHPWLVTNASGQCLAIYVTGSSSATVSINGLPPQNPPTIASVTGYGASLSALAPAMYAVINGKGFGTTPQVTLNGATCPLFLKSDTQISFQVPSGASIGSGSLVVQGATGSSPPFPVTINPAAPVILAPVGSPPSLFQYSAGNPITTPSPGDNVYITVNGLGSSSPSPPRVQIDGADVSVLGVSAFSYTLDGPGSPPRPVPVVLIQIPPIQGGRHSLSVIASGVTSAPAQFTVLANGLILTTSGLTFNAVQGGPKPAVQSFSVMSGAGALPFNVATSIYSGPSGWLSVSPQSGLSQQGQNGVPVTVTVDPSGLSQGAYYGLIQVSSQGVSNSPQSVSVVLTVAPPSTNVEPYFDTRGLIFVGTPNGSQPAPQTVTIWNPTPSAVSYTASVAVSSGTNPFTFSPAAGSITPGQPIKLTVQASVTGATPGAQSGIITLAFSGGITRTVSLLLVVASTSKPAGAQLRPALTGCTPTQLFPVFTQPGANFNVPAAWPTPVALAVVDDCGTPLGSGNVSVSFSNGDPPLTLVSSGNGSWAATWPPQHARASGINITASATLPALNLKGSATISGGVSANNVPMVFQGGVVDLASYTPLLSPGGMIAIFGNNLSQGNGDASAFPLPPQLQGTIVVLGGHTLPLRATSSGQIAAIVPYDIPLNTGLQLILQNGNSVSTPQSIPVVPAVPAVFTPDQSGKGQGHIYTVNSSGTQILANSTAPAKPGDLLVIYGTGLGAVTPQAQAGMATPTTSFTVTANPVTVTIGGKTAPAPVFEGLIPGLTGIYQVVVAVPPGLPDNDATTLMLSVLGQDSSPVTFSLRNPQ